LGPVALYFVKISLKKRKGKKVEKKEIQAEGRPGNV
jgi:hypothetical protein